LRVFSTKIYFDLKVLILAEEKEGEPEGSSEEEEISSEKKDQDSSNS
jgi:hypothetical protein